MPAPAPALASAPADCCVPLPLTHPSRFPGPDLNTSCAPRSGSFSRCSCFPGPARSPPRPLPWSRAVAAPPGRQRRTLSGPGPGDTPADLPPDPPFPTPSPRPTRAPRGRARPAVLAACSIPRRTTPADLHLGRANSGDAPPAGRPEEGRAATQRDPPRPTGAPPTSRGHARTCPARPPAPRPLQTGGRSLRTCPTAPPATRGLTTRVVREDRPPRRAGPGAGTFRPAASCARMRHAPISMLGMAMATQERRGRGRAREEARRGRRSDGHGTGGRAQ